MIDNNELTILVCSSDGYEDVWPAFFFLLKKYWVNLQLDIVLNTENKKFDFEGLKINCFSLFHSQIDYGKRLIAHLKRIKTPFVLILMEDFFIRKKVDEDFIKKTINYFKEDKKAVCFNFEYSFDSHDEGCANFPEFLKRPKYGDYKLNFQAAIWKRKALLSLLRKHESPWEIEWNGNYRTFTNRFNFYTLKRSFNTPIDYGYDFSGSGIRGGKWNADNVVELFKQEGIKIDFSKRGFTSEQSNDSNHKNTNSKFFCKEIRFIKSVGLLKYFRILFCRIYIYFRRKKDLSFPKNYVHYKRRKYKITNKRIS